jgi:hypothetical protein
MKMKTKKKTTRKTKDKFDEAMNAIGAMAALEQQYDSECGLLRGTVMARIEQAWQTMQLGNAGVVVVAKDWNEGPERRRLKGLDIFVGTRKTALSNHRPDRASVQVSPNGTSSAILDGRNQSAEFAKFLTMVDDELHLLGTIPNAALACGTFIGLRP